MPRYYDVDIECIGGAPLDTARTRLPRNILVNHELDTFLDICERRLGSVIGAQARALLAGRAFCEDQNANALAALRGLAADMDEWGLALHLGHYFDRMSY